MEPAKRRSSQGDRMGKREGRNRSEQALKIAHQDQKAKHEEKMVEAEQDVFDP